MDGTFSTDSLMKQAAELSAVGQDEAARQLYESYRPRWQALGENSIAAQNLEFNYGLMLMNCWALDEALAVYHRLTQLMPNHYAAFYQLANVYQRKFEAKTAQAYITKARALDPHNLLALSLEAIILANLGALKQAETILNYLINRQPDNHHFYHDRSLVRLLAGNYEGGFIDYEHRWGAETHLRSSAAPLHQQFLKHGIPALTHEQIPPSSLAGRVVLVYGEQGFGDMLHFSRFLPMLKQTDAKIIFFWQLSARPHYRLFGNMEII